MRRMFTSENLEDFLKRSADELQMRPSEAVWDKLSKKLADSRRRTFLLSGLFLLGFFATGYLLNQQPLKTTGRIPNNTSVTKQQAAPVLSNTTSGTTTDQTPKTARLNSSNSIAFNASSVSTPASAEQRLTSTLAENTSAPFTDQNHLVSIQPNNSSVPKSSTQTTTATKPSAPKKESTASTAQTENIKPLMRKRKWSFQFYFTPTVSYRRLTDNQTFNTALSSTSTGTNVDNAVFHKPDIGFELGTSARYNISNRVRLRAGLQLSLHRYDIRAYDYVPEVAAIALNSGYSQPVIINTITTHRNTDGFRTDWLQNSYVKISAPIGLETRIRGNEKTYIGVAGTLQPSYLLGDNAYLLSADFKNYANAANLVRRWNMSTSVETFVNYSTGHLQWQVGPQVRYQLMSSFIKAYPVKENLFDFGFKIGISANRAPQPK